MTAIKELFMLSPDIVFLNHGSFGACPRPVFEVYQEWQRRLEVQPVRFITRELPQYLQNARHALGQYVNVDKDDLVFVPNATFGVNVVARSIKLGPGDEVLATDHEYGACDNVWRFLSQKRGFQYRQQSIPLPVTSQAEIEELFWQGVTDHTKVIFISHITSPTALTLPIKAICRRAREMGILTLIDGAHALGQIDLDLMDIDPDFYTSNAHKWLCSPKGSAFLYTRRDMQSLIEPLVIGWGWGKNGDTFYGSDYLDSLQWLGTNDLSAYLSIPAAIQFLSENNWTCVRDRSHKLVGQALRRVCDMTGLAVPYPDNEGFYHQMAAIPVPPSIDLPSLKVRLYGEYRIEIPPTRWKDQQFLRISIQGYNDQSDIDILIEALHNLINS